MSIQCRFNWEAHVYFSKGTSFGDSDHCIYVKVPQEWSKRDEKRRLAEDLGADTDFAGQPYHCGE